jgi:hypothetical protein
MVMVDRRPARRQARAALLQARRAEKKARLAIPVTPPPPPVPSRPVVRSSSKSNRAIARALSEGAYISPLDALTMAGAVILLGKHLVRARMRGSNAEDQHVEFQADTPEAAAALIARLDPFQNPAPPPVVEAAQ